MNNKGLEQLVEEALSGIEGPSDDARLGQFRKVAKALKTPIHAASAEAIQRAKAIMPMASRSGLLARLAYCSLQPQAVRSAVTESFQMVFESEACKVRMMFSPVGDRWDVLGEFDGEVLQVTQNGRRLAARDGRFSFRAATLKQTGLILDLDSGSVQIPSALEAALGHAEPD